MNFQRNSPHFGPKPRVTARLQGRRSGGQEPILQLPPLSLRGAHQGLHEVEALLELRLAAS